MNYEKLNALIIKKFGSLEDFSKAIGWSMKKLNSRMSGEKEFVQWELCKIRDLLQMTDDQVMDIFFPDTVTAPDPEPAARILTIDEIRHLPMGAVVWRESHAPDCETNTTDIYCLDPLMVVISDGDRLLTYTDRTSEIILDINDELLNEGDCFWNSKPSRDQIKTGVPIEEFYSD